MFNNINYRQDLSLLISVDKMKIKTRKCFYSEETPLRDSDDKHRKVLERWRGVRRENLWILRWDPSVHERQKGVSQQRDLSVSLKFYKRDKFMKKDRGSGAIQEGFVAWALGQIQKNLLGLFWLRYYHWDLPKYLFIIRLNKKPLLESSPCPSENKRELFFSGEILYE